MKKRKVFSIYLALIIIFSSVYTTQIYAAENEKVILGGTPFGIKMFSQGLMVIKTEAVKTTEGRTCPAEKSGIKVNDIIVSANEKEIKSNEELAKIIENSEGKNVRIELKRNEQLIKTIIAPVKNDEGIYKAGLWVKDSAAGIGTVTFFTKESNGFCALGHGICESNTGMLIPLAYGEVENAYIASVTKSSDGKVGALNGYFTNGTIGTATLNSNEGIYGTSDYCSGTEIEIADCKDIEVGKAKIYTTVFGEQPEYYDAEIVRIGRNSQHADMIIKITDKELLERTGGIVQGMSGSPVIQNGKLAGAVTHVIIDDVDCGYAIFAQRMFEVLAETCS